ncbi:hypothetical protein DU508_17715 [Pedobacter chinensis]|uniref:Uncharacterized protein n=1 Tax=Pedobacter chinensis TaxID=2282421 RepID=A0A369PZ99_9SPHI|nr:hypothetical protein DU508_17715 [Pedobacter chinensis]
MFRSVGTFDGFKRNNHSLNPSKKDADHEVATRLLKTLTLLVKCIYLVAFRFATGQHNDRVKQDDHINDH